MLLLLRGLRISEALSLRAGDITLRETGTELRILRKGRTARQSVYSDDRWLTVRLAELAGALEPDGRVFGGLDRFAAARVVKAIGAAAGCVPLPTPTCCATCSSPNYSPRACQCVRCSSSPGMHRSRPPNATPTLSTNPTATSRRSCATGSRRPPAPSLVPRPRDRQRRDIGENRDSPQNELASATKRSPRTELELRCRGQSRPPSPRTSSGRGRRSTPGAHKGPVTERASVRTASTSPWACPTARRPGRRPQGSDG